MWCYHESTPCIVRHKRGHMKYTLHICTSRAQATSNSDIYIKPIALVVVELRPSEGIRQAVN